MVIDSHAHFLPAALLDALEKHPRGLSMQAFRHPTNCACTLKFRDGLELQALPARLIESVADRKRAMDAQGVHRQILSTWADMFGYQLEAEPAVAWHRLLNEHMAAACRADPARFSMLASLPLPFAEESALELEHAVKNLGAVGAVIGGQVRDRNVGDFDLDPVWRVATDLDVGIFLHPSQPLPALRARTHALNQTVGFTADTTYATGSLILSGVLDRFPNLRILLAHGGGTFPFLSGRFDRFHELARRNPDAATSRSPPSTYLSRFFYDTLVYDVDILAWLAQRVSVDRMVLGSDYAFPPADPSPVESLRKAGFCAADFTRVTLENPRALFPALPT